ncbi:hypothetical protein JOC70_000130 [Clostridium pascui]|uniref:hypothetical protein n=1 Tax=Clostridium pascui TaxID=46609 RepID=UPI00195C21D5|nr:hypothetical protein [Clostridium pascui]MBM7868661.1 hypothetical protein [Clostridium pascui]
MKKKFIFIFLVCIAFLIGCSKEETFGNFFNTSIQKMHEGEKNFSYSLIHTEMNVIHENDAIAVFVENRSQEDVIFIGYFEKENNKWNWRRTRGAKWNSPINWTLINDTPHIYSGAINDKSISKVLVGKEQAEIIEVEGDKRFWYAVNDAKDIQVKFIKNDGTEEIIKELK